MPIFKIRPKKKKIGEHLVAFKEQIISNVCLKLIRYPFPVLSHIMSHKYSCITKYTLAIFKSLVPLKSHSKMQ